MYEDNETESMSHAAKLGIIAGALGLTGLIAWAYSDKGGGPLGFLKKSSGPSRTYLAGGGETASSLAAKYNAAGHEADIIAANTGLVWPLSNGDHVVIPDTWALLYSAKTSSGPGGFLARGGETAAWLAAQLNPAGNEFDLVAANPNLAWPLTPGEYVVVPHQWAVSGYLGGGDGTTHPGGWPNTSGAGHYTDWHAHHQREDFAGWSSEHAARGGHSADYQHGYQVGTAAAKLGPNSPITANVSTKAGGANLWNGSTWTTTSADFQQGWHAGLTAARHQHVTQQSKVAHTPTSGVASGH